MASNPNIQGFSYTRSLIPVFDGETESYDYWSLQMKTLFISKDLLDFVENGYAEPESAADMRNKAKQKEYKKNRKKDAKALLYLQQGVSKDIFRLISEVKNSKEAWDILREEFQGSEKKGDMDKTKDCAPSTDLISKYLPLYKAAKEGDWKKAKNFIDNNDKDGKDTAVTARITVSNDTALHIAAAEGHSDFVEELVKLMTSEQLELKNFDNETALQLAAVAGNLISIKAMVGKNPALVNMRDRYGCIPLLNVTNCALSNDQKEDMIQYLYRVMIEHPGKPSLFSGDLGRQIICSIIGDGFFGEW